MTFFNRQGRAALFAAAAVGLGLLAAGCGKKDAPAPDAAAALADPRDGQQYKTAVIGGRTWMAQNLNYQTESGSWCYGNSADSCAKYGRLYDWETAKTVCPDGWKLPSREEWAELVAAAGGDEAGKALKSSSGWNENGNGTDTYGFSALPGGTCGSDGGFVSAGNYGIWWTATEFDGSSSLRWRWRMSDANDYAEDHGDVKSLGFSVRCLKVSAVAEKPGQGSVSEKTEQPEDGYNLEDNNADASPAEAEAAAAAAFAAATAAAAESEAIDGRDGQHYNTVKIGGQTWMAANLNYQTESGSWCYGDDKSNCDKYGRLYDWNTAKTACPKGWHLPSREEWNALVSVAGGDEAGKALKSASGWMYKNISGNGIDRYGFSAMPGGFLSSHHSYAYGSFMDAGGGGYWWTADEDGGGKAYYRIIGYADDGMGVLSGEKDDGYSVRCIKE